MNKSRQLLVCKPALCKSLFNFNPRRTLCLFAASVCLVSQGGCDEPAAETTNKPKSIINQTTDDIGEFKPGGDDQVADLQVKESANPLAAMGAYGFAVSEISKQQIQRAIQLFQAEHGRFPQDHEEFMAEIVKKNGIKLPVLPGKRRYQYDVDNHELVVVEAAD